MIEMTKVLAAKIIHGCRVFVLTLIVLIAITSSSVGWCLPMIVLPIQRVKSNYKQAELVFHNVLHTHDSYEVRVFLSQTKADLNTLTDRDENYAGSLFFYGQDRHVKGQEGYIADRAAQEYDRSPGASNTSPFTLYLDITDKLHQFVDCTEVAVSFVAIDRQGHKITSPDFKFDSISLDVQ
jgi:hypothetical protein